MTERQQLIKQIEALRGSKVISYFLSDRTGALAQIAEDAVRPMYDHLRAIGPVPKIDLFLYSIGGMTDVPWRIVSMIREFTEEFAVLIPYKAMSAATMIALGADEIVMGRKGELGPIDPQLQIERGGDAETSVQEQIAVEDIMSYIRFVRQRVEVKDEAALAGIVTALAERVDPRTLGQINRMHSHIRDVARKLLMARSEGKTPDEAHLGLVIETLAEQTFQHGHAIGRREAKTIGLNVIPSDGEIEDLMWSLFEAYEELCGLRKPLDPHTFIPADQNERREQLTIGCIESAGRADHCTTELRLRNRRQPPPQLALTFNLNLQLPPKLQSDRLPEALRQTLEQQLQQFQANAQALVEQALMNQMPIIGFEGGTVNTFWSQVGDWPTA
jgi:hypothetical protein